jgi:hypothetical protein
MLNVNEPFRTLKDINVPSGTKGRVCGINPNGDFLVALWVKVDDNILEPIEKGEKHDVA